MSIRRLSTRRLVALLCTAAASAAAVGAIAVAASGGGGATPPATSLPQAVHDALSAPEPAGVTARVSFTNDLFPSASMFGNAGSALISGAHGRLWITNDGRGRIELQSDAGDTQIVWSPAQVTAYDASSNTVYRLDRGASKPAGKATPPSLGDVTGWLTKLAQHAQVSGAQPDSVAGGLAYSVTVSPKENGGLVGSAQLAWDAAHGVPLQIAVTAKGSSSPVLELKATDISFGPVAASAVDVVPPSGVKVVDLGSATGKGDGTVRKPVTGLDAVRAAVPFTLVAPATASGKTLSSARVVGKEGALLTYGKGLDALVVVERRSAGSAPPSALGSLPKVPVGSVSAHALETPLGTVLSFDRNGVAFVVGGSMTSSAVQAAAAPFAE